MNRHHHPAAVAPSPRRAALTSSTALAGYACLTLFGSAASLALAPAAQAQSLPAGGLVSAGGASISTGPGTVTVNQSSQRVAINWQSFSIGRDNSVVFVQPNSSSVALNRVLGADASVIFGSQIGRAHV